MISPWRNGRENGRLRYRRSASGKGFQKNFLPGVRRVTRCALKKRAPIAYGLNMASLVRKESL